MAMIEDMTFKILTIPEVGKWVKIGEVYKRGIFRALYTKYKIKVN